MPIYEYRCSECQQLFEEWCKHVEDASVEHACPICKGAAQRIISNTSFALKGGGWYATEYGSRKTPPSDGASATAAPVSDSPAKGECPTPAASGAGCAGSCPSAGTCKPAPAAS